MSNILLSLRSTPAPRQFAEIMDEAADEIERLKAQRDALAEALRWYEDSMCEGFCLDFKTKDFYDESMDSDCAGCKARAALAMLEKNDDQG